MVIYILKISCTLPLYKKSIKFKFNKKKVFGGGGRSPPSLVSTIVFTYRSTMDTNKEADESAIPWKPIGTDMNFFNWE